MIMKNTHEFSFGELGNYQNLNYCSHCGELLDNEGILVCYDGDEDNKIPSNLDFICPDCFANKVLIKPKITISKDFEIEACHYLPNYDGKCYNIHGHTWFLRVAIEGYIQKGSAMVMDYKELKNKVEECVVDVLDHSKINDFIPNPTAECMVLWIWKQLMSGGLKGIKYVELWETSTSCCRLDKNDMKELFQ